MKRQHPLILSIGILIGMLAWKPGLETEIASFSARRPAIAITQAAYLGHSMKRYSLGMDDFLADLIWVQLLQQATHTPLQNKTVSWEYAQLEAITALDPKFEEAYAFGAAFLSVFRQDKIGAWLLLEKWVKHRPTFWKSHYTLGYHLYAEMGDYASAAPHILTAASLQGAPVWLTALGIRLLSESGALAQALKVCLELYSTVKTPLGQDRIKQRIHAIRFQMEKIALQAALKEYRNKHHAEPPGLEALRPFVFQDRELASVVSVDDAPEELRSVLVETFPFLYDPKTRSIQAPLSDKELRLDQTGIFHTHTATEKR
jgi:hypothetical protein